MEQANPRDFTYTFAVAAIMLYEDSSESIREERFKAIRKAMGITAQYLKEGIRPDLIDVIMAKKADLILNATTLADIRKAADPPKPHYNGNAFYDDPLHVPEEEMVLWSKTSLMAPLNSEGLKRYLDLFTRTFGITEDDLLNGNLDKLMEES